MPNPKKCIHDNGLYNNVVYWTPEIRRHQLNQVCIEIWVGFSKTGNSTQTAKFQTIGKWRSVLSFLGERCVFLTVQVAHLINVITNLRGIQAPKNTKNNAHHMILLGGVSTFY